MNINLDEAIMYGAAILSGGTLERHRIYCSLALLLGFRTASGVMTALQC